MQCFAMCVMINNFGVCESAMRKPEHVEKVSTIISSYFLITYNMMNNNTDTR